VLAFIENDQCCSSNRTPQQRIAERWRMDLTGWGIMRKGLIAGMAALAAITLAPIANADNGDQASAEQAVRAVYSRITCGSPPMPMSLQSIQWDSFTPASFGEGRIIDANPRLGGPFQVAWTNPRVGPAKDAPPFRAYGQWGVNLEFC
jgi:hypothetical protein